mgnify:CR=1 FL=1
MYRPVQICTGFLVFVCAAMAKKPSGGGFRLDLGEPLAGQLADFCEQNFRTKTQVIREALTAYFEQWATAQDNKADK